MYMGCSQGATASHGQAARHGLGAARHAQPLLHLGVQVGLRRLAVLRQPQVALKPKVLQRARHRLQAQLGGGQARQPLVPAGHVLGGGGQACEQRTSGEEHMHVFMACTLLTGLRQARHTLDASVAAAAGRLHMPGGKLPAGHAALPRQANGLAWPTWCRDAAAHQQCRLL